MDVAFLIPLRIFQNVFSFGKLTQSFDFEQGSQPREWGDLYNSDVFKDGIWGFFGEGFWCQCDTGLLKVLNSVHWGRESLVPGCENKVSYL